MHVYQHTSKPEQNWSEAASTLTYRPQTPSQMCLVRPDRREVKRFGSLSRNNGDLCFGEMKPCSAFIMEHVAGITKHLVILTTTSPEDKKRIKTSEKWCVTFWWSTLEQRKENYIKRMWDRFVEMEIVDKIEFMILQPRERKENNCGKSDSWKVQIDKLGKKRGSERGKINQETESLMWKGLRKNEKLDDDCDSVYDSSRDGDWWWLVMVKVTIEKWK